jgi:CRISPR-associated protein Cmr6
MAKKQKIDFRNMGAALGIAAPVSPISEKLPPMKHPLQTLKHEKFDRRGRDELALPVLKAAVNADNTCSVLYKKLCEQMKLMADPNGIVMAEFPWRMRVGGMRGFRDLLLPVFHPTYGIPYVPSSSIKGLIRAWARHNLPDDEKYQVAQLLGFLDGKKAAIAKVQILDSFPTKPCLSVDIANPQWAWDRNQVKYGAIPHHLLSMQDVTLQIGLQKTSRGSAEDVQIVKRWLQQALLSDSLGSRVSAGYGRAKKVDKATRPEVPYQHQSEHEFEFWSQGMYGSSTENPEFRPVAIRGMLRYWFRAISFGLYPIGVCQRLEGRLFGTLDDSTNLGKPRQGSIVVSALWRSNELEMAKNPMTVTGKVILKAQSEADLLLAQKLLELSFCLGGVGRGARRPLHINRNQLRGCHWQPKSGLGLLENNRKSWQDFFQSIKDAIGAIQVFPADDRLLVNDDPGRPGRRFQDVLSGSSRIYTIDCPGLQHPREKQIAGKAMSVLYKPDYKGKSLDNPGEPLVGGGINKDPRIGGTPSFVVVKSVFPPSGNPYQVVTIFGETYQEKRQAFAQALEAAGGVLVWQGWD